MAAYHKRKTYWKNKIDSCFSEIIRLRAGKCEETNGKMNLQCAHLISRSYKSTRWDLDNAICLSRERHKYYTEHPLEWELFLEKKIGSVRLEELKERAIDYKVWTLEELKELYDIIY